MTILPADPEERKATPIYSGVLRYFPLALAAVARVSKRGNDQHNPGEPLHWSRDKSTDHADAIARHLIDLETVDEAGEYADATALAWRALAWLQEREEARLGKAPSPGSRVDARPLTGPELADKYGFRPRTDMDLLRRDRLWDEADRISDQREPCSTPGCEVDHVADDPPQAHFAEGKIVDPYVTPKAWGRAAKCLPGSPPCDDPDCWTHT